MEALKEEDEENKESTFKIVDNDDAIQPSNITIDNVIMDSGRKEMLLNSINNFITFYSDRENNQQFKETYGYGNGLILVFTGTSGCGKTMLSYALANYFKKKIVNIGISSALDSSYSFNDKDNYDRAQELLGILDQANKMNAITLMDEADKNDQRITNISNILTMIDRFEGILILTSNNSSWCNGSLLRRINHIFRFDIPTQEEQFKIWQVTIPDAYKDWFNDVDFHKLSTMFNFTGGLIKIIIQSCIREAFNSETPKVTMDNIIKIGVNLSKQIFNQYSNTTGKIEHFFNSNDYDNNNKKNNTHSNLIAIDSKYYKESYKVLDKAISSYDTYRKIKGLTMFTNGNQYDTTINSKGRVTLVNSADITYTLQVLLEVLHSMSLSARIIDQEMLFDTHLISHPLYKDETTFLKAISDPILGIKCPLIILDNNINDIINKIIPDLNIIYSKTSKKDIFVYHPNSDSIKHDINDTDDNNFTTTMSVVGEMLLSIINKDYSDVYILVNVSGANSNTLDNLCKSLDNIYYINLQDIVKVEDRKNLLRNMIKQLNDSSIVFDSKKLNGIIDKNTESFKRINPMNLSSIVKNAYIRAITECKEDKSDIVDKFYETLTMLYNRSNGGIVSDNPMFR